MPQDPAPVARTPDALQRRWIGVAVALFLLAQLLLPLRYYLSPPTSDERFAWRMFSSVRMRDCTARLYETIERDGKTIEEPVPPATLAHWRDLLDGNRPEVVEAVMRSFRRRPGVRAVRFELKCRGVDGRELPTEGWVMESADGSPRRVEGRSP
ncbi:MAG: hypothetical protein K8S99_07100 [Planctomycetes bacterium]|nr:hypothetical protein [Planctomycetota bacterium]